MTERAPVPARCIALLDMVAFFLGGAIGSMAAGFAWQHGGWIAVCAAGAVLAGAGLAVVARPPLEGDDE